MSGSEEDGSRGQGVVMTIRSLIIAGMMACVVMSLVGLLRRIAPHWPGEYLALLTFFVCLEGMATERQLRERSTDPTSKLKARLAEGVIILIVLRVVLSLLSGWTNLLRDMYRWLGDPLTIFDPGYLLTSLILLLVWLSAIALARDLSLLESSPTRVSAPPITSSEYWIWITRPRGGADSQAAIQHLNAAFLQGGILLLLFAGLSRIDIKLATHLAHPSTPGIILNALIYFILGLALLSQAHFAILRSRWDEEGLEVVPGIGQRWAILALASVSVVGLVALLLPTNYSAGILETLYTAAWWIVSPIARALLWIASWLLVILGSILQFIFGNSAVPGTPRKPPPPPEMQPPVSGGLGWIELLRTLLFWALLMGIVGYSFYHYFRARGGLWSKLKRIRLMSWLVGLWRALLRGGRRAAALARVGLDATLKRLRPSVSPPSPPWRFISLRSLSKRELVRYFYLSIVRRAGQIGWRRRPSQTPYEYQEVLEERAAEASGDVAALTQAFVESRYSMRDFSPEEAGAVKQAWRRVRAFLRQAARGGAPPNRQS